jgi:hypothetical protein
MRRGHADARKQLRERYGPSPALEQWLAIRRSLDEQQQARQQAVDELWAQYRRE